MDNASTSRSHAVNDWPLYWFSRLEKSVLAGDHQAAAEAQRELDRLGVRVNYGRPAGETRKEARRER